MSGKITALSGVIAVCALTAFGAARAAEPAKSPIPGTFSANVALTTEYYFRGISQTDDAPALQGGIDWEMEIAKPTSVYLGVWGSNVDFNEAAGIDGATVELDWYGGLKGSIGKTGLSWNAGFIYYSYPGAGGSLNYDFWELQGSLGYDFGVAAVTASLNWSPDNFGGTGDAYYPKLAVDVPVPMVKDLTFSAYVAKQFVDGPGDYLEWNLGLGYSFAGFDMSLHYSDTDISPSTDGVGPAAIFTIGRSF